MNLPNFASSIKRQAIFDLVIQSNGFSKTHSLGDARRRLLPKGRKNTNNNGNKDFKGGTPGRGLQRTVK